MAFPLGGGHLLSAHSRTLVVRAEMLVGERKQVQGMADEWGHVAAQNDGRSRGRPSELG